MRSIVAGFFALIVVAAFPARAQTQRVELPIRDTQLPITFIARLDPPARLKREIYYSGGPFFDQVRRVEGTASSMRGDTLVVQWTAIETAAGQRMTDGGWVLLPQASIATMETQSANRCLASEEARRACARRSLIPFAILGLGLAALLAWKTIPH